MFELSQLHFHSIGQVSANKKFGSRSIKAFPIEYRFNNEEVVVDQLNVIDLAFKTNHGDDNIQATMSNSIECLWLNFNGNRYTAPDVRRNDKVLIYRMGNSEQYYWMDFNDRNVKRLETVVYVWSADANNPIKEDLSNAYYLEMSTHNKTVTFKTSQANEEPYGYVLQFNTGEGHVVLQDTDANEVLLDSAATLIRLTNAAKSTFELNKDTINGYAPKDINFEAGQKFTIKCKDYTNTADNSLTTTTKTRKDTASSGHTMDTPLSIFTTDVQINSNLLVSGQIDTPKANILSLGVGSIGPPSGMKSAKGAASAKASTSSNSVTFTSPVTGPECTFDKGAIKTLSGDSVNYKTGSFPSGHGPH